jgi:lysophospholipase L1-like esterase
MHRSRWWRRVRKGLALLVVVLVAASCVDRTDVRGSRVIVVGDSILAQSESEVRAALEADGWHAAVKGIGGIPIQGWRKGIQQYVKLFHPDVAVVELGTNNCASSPCEDISAYIDAIMHELTKSARVVFWLNTRDLPIKHPADADYVNRELADAAVRWPNLVIVDMNGRLGGHPELLDSGGLHFNDQGRQEFAQLIRDALHDLSPAAHGGALAA